MPLTPEEWPRAREVFERALELPSGERLAYVAAACGSHGALRGEVERMLASHRAAPDFLAAPAAVLLTETREAQSLEGQRIGPYLLSSRIGAGGMGVVYKARDTRLDRTVAVKVLPAESGGSAHARERFEREARAVAALNHPHICTLFDVGEAPTAAPGSPQPSALSPDPVRFLVMEHLDGETLAARLARGPLPLDRAMAIAVQIASALDAAHRAGIIHRDLKPGNVMLTKSGAKLLDFGLAKATAANLGRDPTRAPSASELTIPGTILGTVQYMAPEQIEGRAADARTDIFAFGAMLYEMIAGRKAFEGGSEASVMAAILEREPPPLSTVQPLAPPVLDRIVTTCLVKDPDDRWQTARDLLRELTWLRDGEVAAAPAPGQVRRRRGERLAGAAALIVAAIAVFVAYRTRQQAVLPAAPVSFSIYAPEGTKFPRGTAEMAISPDGGRLAFVALSSDGTRRMWIRRFDSVNARLLEGTEDAHYPFWSPDGRSVGFFGQGKVKRIAEVGGGPQIVCDVPGPGEARGGTWSRDSTILFGGSNRPIMRVTDTGGVPAALTTLDESRQELGHYWPVLLDDGRRFLYLARSANRERSGVYQRSLDSTTASRLLTADSNGSAMGGHLFVVTNGSLVAHPYDPDRTEIGGEPIQVAAQVGYFSQRADAAFSVAPNRVLAYRSASADSHLIWFDRGGRRLGSFRAPGDYQHPWLSPDEKRVAVEKTDPATGRHTIWILDLARELTSRLVFDAAGAHGPVWSPDGARMLFFSNRLGGVDMYWIRADGAGTEELVLNSPEKIGLQGTDWSHDGRFILYEARAGQSDLWWIPLPPGQKPRPFVATASNERQGMFSPDAQWIAYTSDESGSYEVYVRRFPGGESKWQVSTHGGAQPRWRGDGKELYYLAPDGRLMAADVKAASAKFETGEPRDLFNTGITASFMDRRNQYVVTRDGQRFLVNISAEDENSAPITVVLNWQTPPKK